MKRRNFLKAIPLLPATGVIPAQANETTTVGCLYEQFLQVFEESERQHEARQLAYNRNEITLTQLCEPIQARYQAYDLLQSILKTESEVLGDEVLKDQAARSFYGHGGWV